MLAKKILATIFALVILLKLIIAFTNPATWLGFTGAFLGHDLIAILVYLVLALITGYYIFSTLELIDIAVVMFFTSVLVALSLVPYSTQWLRLGQEIAGLGLGKAWFTIVIWGALALAVLYRVFSKK